MSLRVIVFFGPDKRIAPAILIREDDERRADLVALCPTLGVTPGPNGERVGSCYFFDRVSLVTEVDGMPGDDGVICWMET